MRLLLDTHVFIWWDSEPLRLTSQVRALCRDPENILLLSVASVWEMQIKMQLGKLKLTLPLAEVVKSQQQINNLQILPISLEHVLALETLLPHHKDPFDRLLIAQANIEKATLVSRDQVFAKYPLCMVW